MSKDSNPRRSIAQRLGWRSAPRVPDWQEWRTIRVAPLWELVAISLRLEPDDIRGWERSAARCEPPPDFHKWLRYAISLLSVNGGGLPCKEQADSLPMAMVELGNYFAWMTYHGYSFPRDFPAQQASAPPREDPGARRARLTTRIEEMRLRRKDFMAFVAGEEGISVQRLQQVVGSRKDRMKTLKSIEPPTGPSAGRA